MADAILARLGGGQASAPVEIRKPVNNSFLESIELRSDPRGAPPEPLNVIPRLIQPPPFIPPPIATFPQPPPIAAFHPPPKNSPQSDFSPIAPMEFTRGIPINNRPNSIKTSIEYFGEGAVDALLGYHRESTASSIALRDMATNIRRKRGIFIGLAILFMGGSCALSASPICEKTDVECMNTFLGTIAGLAAAAAACISISIKISSQSAGSIDGIAQEWDQLGKTIYEALYLSPPTGDSASSHVRRWSTQHRYISERTPPINPKKKKEALARAMARTAQHV